MPYPRRYRVVPINSIYVPRELRQRRELDIDALTKSIAKIGLLQPIVIEPAAAEQQIDWRLVAGECRLAACIELGWRDIPAIAISDLTPVDSQIAELEENIKRSGLPWQDYCRSVARIHQMFVDNAAAAGGEWTQLETSEALSITEGKISEQLRVFAYLNDSRVAEAGTLREAYNIIRRRETRQRSDALMELLEEPQASQAPQAHGRSAPSEDETPQALHIEGHARSDARSALSFRDRAQTEAEATILNVDFTSWAPRYEGQKFNFIHCDFPYGIDHGLSPQARGAEPSAIYADDLETYKRLLACLTDNLERLFSISGHIMFWFSERHRALTVRHVHEHAPTIRWHPFPLIWVKSDNAGIAADHSRDPRHIYETCMLGSRGGRMLVRTMADAYTSKTDHRLHPSCKPEPMLHHFMTMLVDENTRMLDPTCGSGSSVRAAERLGCKHALGLEVDPGYWRSAVDELRNRRVLRGFGQ